MGKGKNRWGLSRSHNYLMRLNKRKQILFNIGFSTLTYLSGYNYNLVAFDAERMRIITNGRVKSAQQAVEELAPVLKFLGFSLTREKKRDKSVAISPRTWIRPIIQRAIEGTIIIPTAIIRRKKNG